MTNEIGKLRRTSAVRNETHRETVGSWKLLSWTDFSKLDPDLRKEAFINLCWAIFIHASYFLYIAKLYSFPMYLQIMIVFIKMCIGIFIW